MRSKPLQIFRTNRERRETRERIPLSRVSRLSRFTLLCAIWLGSIASAAWAQSPPTDLTATSLEDLMNIEVTSASKKEEKLFQTAAAIYVITQDEIRRSGLTSIPELLRLAPGLEVARIDGNKWAISSRGFNGRFANKLLVLIDGRSIYSPETAGVYWEAHHLPVEEIERIEIIRGPGGTLWGSNAVNGVINIITRHAKDTQGGLITAGGGSEEQGFGSARHGGRIGAKAYYRVYARYFNRGGLDEPSGYNAHDWQSAVNGGFRLDWKRSEHDTVTLEGDLYDSSLKERSINRSLLQLLAPPSLTPGEFNGGSLLGRWNHLYSDRSDTTLQIYFDRSRREIFDLGERIDTFDVDLQHHLAIGRRQDLIFGLSYRLIADQTNSNPANPVQQTPKARTVQLFSGFVQNEVMLIKKRLRLTLGAKLEHNDYTGYEVQPNVRLLWTPNDHQTVWAAVSRAVRTPARGETTLRINLPAITVPFGPPLVPTLLGNPGVKSEELRAYEFGYRHQPSKKLSFDLATFYNFYDRLQTLEPGQPFFEPAPGIPHLVLPLAFNNLSRGETYGAELSANFDLNPRWKIQGSYTFLREQIHLYPGSHSTGSEAGEGENPRHQFQVHSFFKLPRNFELDAALYRVSRLPSVQIPGYTRLDARFGWKAGENFELSLGLQNLLDDRHPEYNSRIIGAVTSQPKRSIYGKAAWRF
ncbi:MAG TPA: TonB-dependent receptor [Blastocatellia bacterium]|nr:TonB-dependent receptor [Blastocatellia bacterium]